MDFFTKLCLLFEIAGGTALLFFKDGPRANLGRIIMYSGGILYMFYFHFFLFK